MLRINKNTILNCEEEILEKINENLQKEFNNNISKTLMDNITKAVNDINKKKTKGPVNYVVVSEEIAKTLEEIGKTKFVYLKELVI